MPAKRKPTFPQALALQKAGVASRAAARRRRVEPVGQTDWARHEQRRVRRQRVFEWFSLGQLSDDEFMALQRGLDD